jgi:hypothetical protein
VPFKKALTDNLQDWVTGTLGLTTLFKVASVGANVANTTVSDLFVLPANCKITKIAIASTAIAALTGHSFNIVLGTTGAYTQGNVPTNDNSETDGYPTNFATNGMALFAADVVLNAANTGFATATGGSAVFSTSGNAVPAASTIYLAAYDAIYPNGGILTLRLTTPASTGSISNFVVAGVLEPRVLNPTNVTQTASFSGTGGVVVPPQLSIQPGSSY